jgi:cysteine desulfurase / selenocysteine lyase
MDVKKLRKDFPIYEKNDNLTYLDSAASSLKLKCVTDQMAFYYHTLGVNVHRGAYELAYEATRLYEASRVKIAKYINAEPEDIIFTKGTTASLNLLAHAYRHKLSPGDEIITSELEHHSSIMPWMMNAKHTGAKLVYIPLTKEGRITVEAFQSVLSDKTKVVAITHVSNVMGYETPVVEIARLAKQSGATVILDAAQSAPHQRIDVKALGIDFLAFSGHKMFGPSGVGILYGDHNVLNTLEPYEFGGEMADEVFLDHATFKEAPLRFEAGTPVISGAIGLGAAIDYLNTIDFEDMQRHNHELQTYTIGKLKQIPSVIIYNETADNPIITFNLEGIHPHDVATMLDQYNVAIRAGHHCAQLVSRFLGVQSTLRVSFHAYNDYDDCDRLIDGIQKAIAFFEAF